ncbi:diaminopropionate ammonia-lyase [Enhydrobacter sp.]|jgi:diaminopropionate ammonia-lyase|uniref:diaminopropionate ammonia-lyase n=1 Tax=Enhydrobacter sp. TaxID=1894999 RepID=UPI00262B8ABF|nr:diaminopropionate ammonia-lyase [Enhydrobacter sp.]WIM11521.1 MAG: Diaminopropionate ammonia-lyase [Enhydrobacter sp.]
MVLDWLARNPRADRSRRYAAAQRAVIDPTSLPDIGSLGVPDKGPTPLLALPALAERLEVGEVRVKDESQRFGFGAFKALGGVFAVHEFMAAHKGRRPADFVFTTASSGNHGRSVAMGAQLVGARCVIFLPRFTSAEKEAAIRARGAEVIRIDGDYDTAVAECRRQAGQNGWTIISDTSWPGYETVPRDVMRGYTVLADEIVRQWPQMPTHVLIQAGVGGLAAALIGYLWATLPQRPLFVIVEPSSADCWFQSNLAGKPASASGNADTVMGGLACREISPITWPVIGFGADWFMTIEEDQVMPTRQLLGHPLGNDPAIASGPSGCAGLAALVRLCGNKDARGAVGLDKDARVLLINSEGNLGEGSA